MNINLYLISFRLFIRINKLTLNYKADKKQKYIHRYFHHHLCTSEKRIKPVYQKCT